MKKLMMTSILFFSLALSTNLQAQNATCTEAIKSIFGSLKTESGSLVANNLNNWTAKDIKGDLLLSKEEAEKTTTAIFTTLVVSCNLPTLNAAGWKNIEINCNYSDGSVIIESISNESYFRFIAYSTGLLELGAVSIPSDAVKKFNKKGSRLQKDFIELLPPELKRIMTDGTLDFAGGQTVEATPESTKVYIRIIKTDLVSDVTLTNVRGRYLVFSFTDGGTKGTISEETESKTIITSSNFIINEGTKPPTDEGSGFMH